MPANLAASSVNFWKSWHCSTVPMVSWTNQSRGRACHAWTGRSNGEPAGQLPNAVSRPVARIGDSVRLRRAEAPKTRPNLYWRLSSFLASIALVRAAVLCSIRSWGLSNTAIPTVRAACALERVDSPCGVQWNYFDSVIRGESKELETSDSHAGQNGTRTFQIIGVP